MVIGLIVSVAEVAPEIFPPLIKLVVPFFHWYVNPVPVAADEKLIEFPSHAVWFAGCVVMFVLLSDKETFTDVSFGAHAPVITTL